MIDAPMPCGQDFKYAPNKINRWLIYWDALTANAEHIGSPNITADPTSSSHLFNDSMRWADCQADILRAWDSLGFKSRQWMLIELVLVNRRHVECHEFERPQDYEAYIVREAGRLMRPVLSDYAAPQVYWDAVRRMARYLGWRPECE